MRRDLCAREGARTPVSAMELAPDFWVPVSLSPAASSSQEVAGRAPWAGAMFMVRCEPSALKSLPGSIPAGGLVPDFEVSTLLCDAEPGGASALQVW